MNYYKARMYSPTLGRFMQPDPIGYGDGMNLYAYAGGDPVNFGDPSGLSRVCEDGLPPLPDGSCGIVVRGAGFSCANGGTGSRTNGNFTCIVDIRFDLSELTDEIVVIARRTVCAIPTINIGAGFDAYAGVGGSGSAAIQVDLKNGRVGANISAGVGVGLGVEVGPFVGAASPITGIGLLNLGVATGGGVAVGGSVNRNLIGTDPGTTDFTVGRVGTPTIYANGNINGGLALPSLWELGCDE